MDTAIGIVVPVSICVILPVLIVWIVFMSINNRTNRQSDIILEAIKQNPNIDVKELIKTMKKNPITPWQRVIRKLLRGCIFTLLGIAFAIVASFTPEIDNALESWVACGICGSVGIGFLIACWFSYKNVEKLKDASQSN